MTTHPFRIVLALMTAGTLLLGACSSGSTDDLAGTSPSATPAAAADDPAPVVPSPPAEPPDPTSVPVALSTSFDRSGDLATLAITGEELDWTVHAGAWTVVDGALMLDVEPTIIRSIATVDAGSPDGVVQAQMDVLRDETGIVFRFVDDANYWAVLAVPAFGTWSIVRVVDAQTVQVADTGVATTEAGTTIAVDLAGPRIRVLINGERVKVVTDASHIDATRSGVVAFGTAAVQARWDDFIVSPAPR